MLTRFLASPWGHYPLTVGLCLIPALAMLILGLPFWLACLIAGLIGVGVAISHYQALDYYDTRGMVLPWWRRRHRTDAGEWER